MTGTSGHEVIWEKTGDVNFLMYTTGPAAIDYWILQDFVGNRYLQVFPQYGTTLGCRGYMKHVTVRETGGGYNGYINFNYDLSELALEDWYCDHLNQTVFADTNAKLLRWTFKEINGSNYSYVRSAGSWREISKYVRVSSGIYQPHYRSKGGQAFLTLDTCVFDGITSSSYHFLTYWGAYMKLKNCTIQNTNDATIYLRHGTVILVEDGLTLAGAPLPTRLCWHETVCSLECNVFSLDLTVVDTDGNIIEDASVMISQNEGKEHHQFLTDASGNITDVYGDLPVFVNESRNVTLAAYTKWSDGTSRDLQHTIVVSKPGYGVKSVPVAFTEDKTLTVTLGSPLDARSIAG